MTRFVLQVAGFLALQFLLGALLLRGYDVPGESNYLAGIRDKLRRAAETASPRILLVGGSNVPFGFRSDLLASLTGRPVVNVGLAAGIGSEFMLAQAAQVARPGDVILLSLEYDQFASGPRAGAWSGQGFDPAILQQVLVFHPGSVACLGPTHFRKVVLDRGLRILGEVIRRRVGQAFVPAPRDPAGDRRRRGFNEHGDAVGHWDLPSRMDPAVLARARLVGEARGFPNPALLGHLARFVARQRERGVAVAFTFPPKPATALAHDAPLAGQLAAALRSIPGLRVLDQPADHGYPPELFFDTANHLTGEGARRRTERVAIALEPGWER
ncbi:MAG: hypothetical protein ACKOET_13875 [Verrucomicrobiota bacterium]